MSVASIHRTGDLVLEEVTMQRVSLDTDPGIDDTAAIFLALASPT